MIIQIKEKIQTIFILTVSIWSILFLVSQSEPSRDLVKDAYLPATMDIIDIKNEYSYTIVDVDIHIINGSTIHHTFRRFRKYPDDTDVGMKIKGYYNRCVETPVPAKLERFCRAVKYISQEIFVVKPHYPIGQDDLFYLAIIVAAFVVLVVLTV